MSKREPTKHKGNAYYTWISVISVLAFLLIWQLLVQYGVVSSKVLAAPTKVFATMYDKFYNPNPDGATLFVNIYVSLTLALTGFTVAVVVGVPLGMLMGWYTPVSRFFRPIFEILRPIPPIAWIPLMILWVGIGLQAKAMIIFFTSFVPCVINSFTGIRSTSSVLISVSKTYGGTNFQTFKYVGVPSAMPMAFAGMRIALGNAWGTLVAAELLAANAGLGFMISMGRQYARPDIIILGMLTIGILGYAFTWLFARLENVVIKWRADQ